MSKYLNPSNAMQRLRNDWLAHGRIIVAVDFDSTLVPYMEDEKSYDFEPIRQLVRDLYNEGCTIIINTASAKDRWPAIKYELEQMPLSYHLFNESPSYIPNIGKEGKVYANAYLDDRAGLAEVYGQLTTLVAEIRLERSKETVKQITKQLSMF